MGRRKMSTTDLNNIIKDYKTGQYTLKEVGYKYGYSESVVSRLISDNFKKRLISKIDDFENGIESDIMYKADISCGRYRITKVFVKKKTDFHVYYHAKHSYGLVKDKIIGSRHNFFSTYLEAYNHAIELSNNEIIKLNEKVRLIEAKLNEFKNNFLYDNLK